MLNVECESSGLGLLPPPSGRSPFVGEVDLDCLVGNTRPTTPFGEAVERGVPTTLIRVGLNSFGKGILVRSHYPIRS